MLLLLHSPYCFKGDTKPPLLPSNVRAYAPLISELIIWQVLPLCQTLSEPTPLPHLSVLPLQLGVPPLHPLAVSDPPLLSVLL